MMGGAYAASQSKVVKGPRGKTGKTGKTGPQGPAGPAGLAGAPGAKGDAGSQGAPGKDGTSVEVNELPAPECEGRSGAEVKLKGAASGTEVCQGEKGDPWTAGGTLPAGAVETGAWAINTTAAAGEGLVSISYGIPLAGELEAAKVHFQTQPNFETFCTGGIEEPFVVNNGELCVWQSNVSGMTFANFTDPPAGTFGSGPEGTIMHFNVTGTPAFAYGAWAVKG
jgi:hypothetical protein